MTDEVYLAGLGACTPVGTNLWSSAAAVRAGLNAFAEHPYMVDKAGERMIVARASYLDPDASLTERLGFLAARAALESCEGVLEPRPYARVAAIVGIQSERHGYAQAVADAIRNALRGVASLESIEIVSAGHSAALIALQHAFERLARGRAEWCLIGGVDSHLEPELLESLDETGQLHSPSNPWGFIPGEAAGFALLTTSRHQGNRGVRGGPRILSVSSARELNLIRTGTVCIGAGLSHAIHDALRGLPPNARVETIISDMNGEPYRADEYGFTVARQGEFLRDPMEVTTPADCWGDVGAASGALFLGLAAVAAQKGYSKGPLTLAWTSSDGGERAAALVDTGAVASWSPPW